MTETRHDDAEILARVRDLQLHFNTERGVVKALDGVDFDVHRGELLALVGETGCGKSITARSFMQLVPQPPGRYVSGQVLMQSRDPCPSCGGAGCEECLSSGKAYEDLLTISQSEIQSYRGSRIAMVFQDPGEALNPSLTIENQVAESILVHRTEEVLQQAGVDLEGHTYPVRKLLRNECSPSRSRVLSLVCSIPPLRSKKHEIREVIREHIIEVLRQTRIPNPREVLSDYPHELSGGQQQRVMIAMALVAQPDLLIADEATSSLDVTTQSQILKLVSRLQDEFESSILYITHDLNLVEQIADRVAVMYAGSIAEIGDVDRVYSEPKHPYTRGLINSIPSEEMLEEDLQGIEGSIPDLTNPPEGCRFATRCPEVMDHCHRMDPPVVEAHDDQVVACHLYGDQQSGGKQLIEAREEGP